MSVVESCTLKDFVERYSYQKAAAICDVSYMRLWMMVENNAPIRIIQNNDTYYARKGNELLNEIKESTLKQRGIT